MSRMYILISSAIGLLTSTEPNWPQWRGPSGQGVSLEEKVPLEWSPEKNILWKTPIEGRGHSSPIVWGNRLFLTTAIEAEVVPGAKPPTHYDEGQVFLHPDSTAGDRRHTLKLLALDTETGKIVWERTAYDGTVYDNRHKKNTFASPTPVTDGERVCAYFESQGVYCYDFAGNLLWKKSLGHIATLGMGPGTSPVLFENLVILQCDEDTGKASFITALDKKTGEEVWRTPRGVQVSWATPFLFEASISSRGPTPALAPGLASGSPYARAEGSSVRVELITSGSELIIAYDPLTGKELWRSKGVESNAIPSPVASRDLVVLSAGFPQKRVFAFRPDGTLVWQYDKGTAYVPSPILYGDYLYLTTDKGVLTCLEAATGKLVYEGGRVPVPATFSASPVALSGKILLTSEDGETFVVDAGPTHRVEGTSSVGEPVFASPAVARGRIYIRGSEHLFCIGN